MLVHYTKSAFWLWDLHTDCFSWPRESCRYRRPRVRYDWPRTTELPETSVIQPLACAEFRQNGQIAVRLIENGLSVSLSCPGPGCVSGYSGGPHRQASFVAIPPELTNRSWSKLHTGAKNAGLRVDLQYRKSKMCVTAYDNDKRLSAKKRSSDTEYLAIAWAVISFVPVQTAAYNGHPR